MDFCSIIRCTSCSEVRHKFIILKFIKRKSVPRQIVVLIPFHVCYSTGIYHQLYIPGIIHFLFVLILRFEVYSGDTTFGYILRTKDITAYCYNGSRQKIRYKQSFETHSGGKHCYYFRVLR